MRNDFIAHSAKGTSWTKKDHKYIRKDGKKYIYKETRTNSETGGSYDVYKNEETGETIMKNNNFKYDPDRHTSTATARQLDEFKSDYGTSHYEMYREEGENIIAELFKKDKNKVLAKK